MVTKRSVVEVVQLNNSNGDKALVKLIDDGAALDKQIKALVNDLDGIKNQLCDKGAGRKYVTPAGNSVTISESDKFTDIDPAQAREALRTKRLGKFFYQCVKVQVTELAKLLNKLEMDALRTRLDPTRRYSFK